MFQQGKPIGTPDPSSYYRMLTDHRIVAMFVAPTAMRALRKEVRKALILHLLQRLEIIIVHLRIHNFPVRVVVHLVSKVWN